MDREIIKKVADEVGLNKADKIIFVDFFNLRFPYESNFVLSYVKEWANRFKQGNQQDYMDVDSLNIYENVLLKKRWKNEIRKS